MSRHCATSYNTHTHTHTYTHTLPRSSRHTRGNIYRTITPPYMTHATKGASLHTIERCVSEGVEWWKSWSITEWTNEWDSDSVYQGVEYLIHKGGEWWMWCASELYRKLVQWWGSDVLCGEMEYLVYEWFIKMSMTSIYLMIIWSDDALTCFI